MEKRLDPEAFAHTWTADFRKGYQCGRAVAVHEADVWLITAQRVKAIEDAMEHFEEEGFNADVLRAMLAVEYAMRIRAALDA